MVGNSLMANARQHVEAVDELLGGLVARLQTEAQTVRDGAVEQAREDGRRRHRDGRAGERARPRADRGDRALDHTARSGAWSTRSRRSPAASSTQPVPSGGRDEIGAMAGTLALFRDSLAERERLTAEREQAQAAVRHMQSRLTDAVESISQGFALFDTDDRLVLCNKPLRRDAPSGQWRRDRGRACRSRRSCASAADSGRIRERDRPGRRLGRRAAGAPPQAGRADHPAAQRRPLDPDHRARDP